MKKKLIRKQDIPVLLREASRDWETYLPLMDEWGEAQFVRLERGEEDKALSRLKLDYQSLLLPPKDVGFPQLEPLFEFQDGGIVPAVPPSRPRLLFGLRACDLRGMQFADEFFRRNFEDVYYLRRSLPAVRVVVGCASPLTHCFCTSAGAGPYLESGFDLQMVGLGEDYLAEVGSEAGAKFVDGGEKYFRDASEGAARAAEREKRRASDAVDLRVDFKKAIGLLTAGEVPREIYEKTGERCIYCGGCLYVCPTCTCFNVFDDTGEKATVRYRNWDACVFSGYTREAGGRNPRQEKWLRTSRRYEHKLKYDYLATGKSGCIGCGRCLRSCPVGIGMSTFIQEIAGNKF